MENLYNAKLSFKGEGNFTFTLPTYGELTVYAGKDIYVKGLNVTGVETLRQLRPLLLDHQLNAKPDGCYRVIDLTENTQPKLVKQILNTPKATVSTVADLKKDLIKTTGPIIEEEPVIEDKSDEVEKPEEKIIEEVKEEPKVEEIKPKTNTTKSKSTKGKTTKKNTKKKTK